MLGVLVATVETAAYSLFTVLIYDQGSYCKEEALQMQINTFELRTRELGPLATIRPWQALYYCSQVSRSRRSSALSRNKLTYCGASD